MAAEGGAAVKEGPRSFTRSVLRSHVEALKESGRLDAVRSRASPSLAALLDRPNEAPAWIEGRTFDELNGIVHGLYGREGLRGLLWQVMASGIAKVIEPIVQFSLSFLGGTPAALFSRANSLVSVNARNIEIGWKQSSPSSGTVNVQFGDAAAPATWIAWEGIAAYILHAAGAKGTVGEARSTDGGRTCAIDVSWSTS